jgi:ABC-type sugar transport system ATPase subunit
VRESQGVLQLIKSMKGEHRTMLLISHNLPHVFDVADRLTVLRGGRLVGTVLRQETTIEHVVGMITGAGMAS